MPESDSLFQFVREISGLAPHFWLLFPNMKVHPAISMKTNEYDNLSGTRSEVSEQPSAYNLRGQPLCYSKQRRLAINRENHEIWIQLKIIQLACACNLGCEKTRGGKMKVTAIMLLITNGGE
jgi:hypothetical protein